MKLSTRSTYGLRALIEIAGQQDLSSIYLEQLLHRLKQHGIVLSLCGPKDSRII